MEKKTLRNLIILLILFTVGLGSNLYWATGGQGTQGDKIVPLTGLTTTAHLLILNAWAMIGSIIMIFIMPLVLIPVFLLMKKIIWSKYTDAYMDTGEDINLKKFTKRIIYIFLLTMGLSATIAAMIDLGPFVSDAHKEHWIGELGFVLEYIPHAFVGLAFMIFPVVIGIWSVGWAFEDIGLMHYKLPNENEKMLYEIEPIHLKFNGIIKGYAGISAIVYFISMITFYTSLGITGSSETISNSITLTFLFIPAYLIYLKVWLPKLKKMFRKGKQPIPIITRREFEDKIKSK